MKSRRSTSVLVALASALATLMIHGCATTGAADGSPPAGAASAKSTVRGTVIYREKTVLPQDAQLTVRLVDISNPAKPNVVAETTIPTAGRQVPIPFALPFDPAKTSGGLTALRATITYGGKIQFVTGARVILHTDALPETLAVAVIPGEVEPTVGDSSAGPSAGPPTPASDPNIPRRDRRKQ